MKQYYINSNIKDVIQWVANAPKSIVNDELARNIAEVFKERARAKLQASQQFFITDISQYVNSIVARKINDTTYRIYAGYGGDDQLKEDMYYLEFGTGIVGASSPHPEASLIGWGYDLNNHGDKGWTFRRGIRFGNQNTFITKDDTVHLYKRKQHKGSLTGWANNKRIRTQDHEVGSDKSIQTKGVIAIRYFYNTMLEFDSIVDEALRRMK